MSLTKVKNSPFWYTELPDKFGDRKRIPTEFRIDGGAKARAAAERVHDERKITSGAAKIEHKAAGSPKKQRTMTLNDGTDLFFEKNENMESPDAGLQQRAKEVRQGLLRLVVGLGPHTKIDELTISDVEDYRDKRMKTITRLDKPIAPATVNKDLELLRRVLRYLGFKQKVLVPTIEWGEVALQVNNKRKRFLREEEEARLFEHLRWDFHPMVKAALMTGMRASNVYGLKWDQVDLEHDQLHVVQKGRRDFTQAMSPTLRAHILDQKGHHPEYVFTYVAKRNRRNVKMGTRTPFTKTGWTESWREALKAAKITNFRFHDNRHTAATRVAADTKHLPTVMEFLGHADIASTMIYAHLCDGAVRKAATDMHAKFYAPKKAAKTKAALKSALKKAA